eukprot:5099333-Pyramimonas_sp.AAC.1
MCVTLGQGAPRVPGAPRAPGTPGARACEARLVRQMHHVLRVDQARRMHTPAAPYQPGAYPYPYAGHLIITMPILGNPLFFEDASLRLSSPLGVSILGIGI